MNWTANKVSKGISNGEVWVQVVYVEVGGEQATVVERTNIVTPDWPDAIIRSRLTQLNGIDLSLVELGAVKPSPVKLPPTQEEIDRAAFLALLRDWQKKKAELENGIGKTTQQDVDDAVTAWKTAYKDEYAPFLVGVL